MGMSYQEVLVDVARYKYLCAEGFLTSSTTPPHPNIRANGYYRHLVQCITEDTGFSAELVERGLQHSALQHRCLNPAFFEAVVTELYA